MSTTASGSSALESEAQKGVPILGEGFQEPAGQSTPKPAESNGSDVDGEVGTGGKQSMRKLFGFGKKKKDYDKIKSNKTVDTKMAAVSGSPNRSPNHPYQSASPQQNIYSSSPRIVSPAGSQLFERDVQENTLPVPSSPAIPSHIQQENHIPAVLDASSEAITDNTLDPESVEIIMHSSHTPASAAVAGIVTDHHTGPLAVELSPHTDKDHTTSNYGALDSTGVRRLSFISFQDIVQSEHMEHDGNRDSLYIAGLSSLSPVGHRSSSPLRSQVSSLNVGSSPPTSKSASVKGLDLSPKIKMMSSPISPQSTTSGGELTIETMSQALRRTGSGDLSGHQQLERLPISSSSCDVHGPLP
ncbi:hypothetical protein BJ878DRAFT_534088 [Calycina marina]|uniref:Uncharacterized protein n=1 Tax=Calycina marina TaxID=1763456 RepID=A0A9P7Z3Z3_9HELO|nr:hypothetical protein BJ878DRAFT_534088 [Calycina marina]